MLPIPSLFSACIRSINKVEAILDPDDNEIVREFAVSSAEFLVRVSPTLKSVFYFAAKSLYPAQVDALEKLDSRTLVGLFHPREVASILGLTFLYRKARKRCSERDWLILGRKIHSQLELGYALGSRMELVGSGNGLLLGGLRFLACSCFAISDSELFSQYRARNRSSISNFDLSAEEKLFGCNHLHVASLILQTLGFNMPRSAASMSIGMDAMNVDDRVLPKALKTQLVSWRAAMSAIDLMHKTGEFLATGENYELKLPPAEEAALRVAVASAAKNATFDWLGKGVQDLPPQISVVLCGEETEEGLD